MRQVIPSHGPGPVTFAVKRAVDVCGGLLLMAASLPLLAAAALAVRATMGPGVLFRQIRIGRHEQPFEIIKLRTMTDAVDAAGRLRSDAERMTPLGRLLRAASIDELPQLWNVLRGEMSLVGPRPLLPHYLPRFTAEQRRRHEVKPGLTGWAQVNGRNAQTWPSRLAFDAWYAAHWSLLLDLRILARTPGVILRGEGVAHDGHATMPELSGPA